MREEDLFYFEEDEFKNCLARYEDMLNGGPSAYLDADELTDIAEYYLVNNDEQAANDCIDYALRLHPGDVDPLVFKARQQMFKGNLKEARTIRDCINDQTDREVYFLNAELLIREEKAGEASAYLWHLAGEMREDKALFLYDCACIFLDYGDYDIALEWTRWMLSLKPGFKALLLIAEIQIAAECYQKALVSLDKALDIDPYSVKAWNMVSEAHFLQEEYYEAFEASDFALAIDECDPYARLMKANCQFHQGHYEEAHALYRVYGEQQNNSELPYFFDGICLMNLNRMEEALEALQKAEELAQGISSEQQQIYLQLAFVNSRLQHLYVALQYLDKAYLEDGEALEYNLFKGRILLENGYTEQALRLFVMAIENSKLPTQTKYAVAVSLSENELYKEAVRLFMEVTGEDADNLGRNSQAYMAYCFFKMEDYDKFLFFLKIAGRVDKENAQAIFGASYPGVLPEEYYLYAYKDLKGYYPDDTD